MRAALVVAVLTVFSPLSSAQPGHGGVVQENAPATVATGAAPLEGDALQGAIAIRIAELDAYWAEVSRAVNEGDFDAYQATCHEEGVLVSGGKQTSQPLAAALARWKQDFIDTREGKIKASVDFRFARRIGDATTAHESGIFRYVSQAPGAEPKTEYIHFEGLLVKRGNAWKILMENQKGPATEAEWKALEYTGEYKPLDSGFNYEKIGIVPRPAYEYAGSISTPAFKANPENAGDPDAAIKDGGKVWVVSDWSEWKLQETAPEGKAEVIAELKESEAAAGGSPMSDEAKKAGVLVLGPGELFSIVKYEGKQPLLVNHYEVSWEGMRLEGSDFFASLTFPVGSAEQCATFVTGGWGGWVTGVSCLEKLFANENETTGSTEFKQGRWYDFRIQVNKESLRAFIDKREIFHVGLEDRAISMHPSEIEKSMPLGFASYATKGAIRNVRIRPLKPGELVAPE